MVKRLTEGAKVRRSFRRSFAQLGRSIPAVLVHNWRNVLMPWRMLPQPVALSLIGLVALAMVCTDPEPGTWQEPTVEPTGDTIILTLGDFVGGETPCQEDEIFDHVGEECIHVDRILPAACAGATQLEYEIEGGSPTCSLIPTPDADAKSPLEGGRTGEIVVAPTGDRAGGTVAYHTEPCHDHDTLLPPPYADVVLCVNTLDYAAVH